MGYSFTTRNGHNMYDMSSMLQKAIRRGNFNHAGYAANELYLSYSKYLWKRLLVISAEDCYGIMTKEIIALKLADDEINKGRKGNEKDKIFIAKAVLLLVLARKNRDACYFACNFMSDDLLIPDTEIPHADLDQCRLGVEGIPDWVFDCHTLKGKKMGKTDLDMVIAEQIALKPHHVFLFYDCERNEIYTEMEHKNELTPKEIETYYKWKQTKIPYGKED